MSKVALSQRVRANCEAAPWVIDEIKVIENEVQRLRDQCERMVVEKYEAEDEASACRAQIEQLKQALTHVRHYMQAQGPNGVGVREFAAICGVSPVVISKWTSPPLPGVPDFID